MLNINIIKDLREKTGLNQEDLAEKLNLSRELINKMENNKIKVSANTKLKILKEFKIDYVNGSSHIENDKEPDLLVVLAEKVIALEVKYATLEKEMNVSLKQILTNQAALMAQIKGASRYALEQVSNGNKKKLTEDRRTLDKYVGEALEKPV